MIRRVSHYLVAMSIAFTGVLVLTGTSSAAHAGHATVYVFDQPFKRVTSYRAGQASAKRHNKGIWKHCG